MKHEQFLICETSADDQIAFNCTTLRTERPILSAANIS